MSESHRDIRRYIAVIQDPRGYPAVGLDPAPPEGPERPAIHTVVKADEHEAALRGAVSALRRIATSPPTTPGRPRDSAHSRMVEIAQEALDWLGLGEHGGRQVCGLCGGYGAANGKTREPVPCMACGKKSEGMLLTALERPDDLVDGSE